MPAGFHKIPEIQKLLKELEEEEDFHREDWNEQYADGIKYCIWRIREIIDSA